MQVEVISANGYDYIRSVLLSGEEIYSQTGALMSVKGTIRIETKSLGGVLTGLKRSLLGGETFFINKYIAESDAELTFSPSLPGEIKGIRLSNNGIMIRDGAYLLHTGNINIESKFFGLKGIFSSGGLFWLYARGVGDIYFNVYGSVVEVDLNNDTILVDNYNLLAFEETLEVNMRKIGGLKTFLFGGEGFLFEIRGTGKVYLQTRNLSPLIYEISKHLHK